MTRLTIGTLGGALIAMLCAWSMGGREGTGVLAGYLLGGSLSGFGMAWQMHLLRTRPQRVLLATVTVYLLKLATLLAAVLCFRYLEPAARYVEWRAFLVAFAGGILLVMVVGSLDTLALLRERRRVA